MGHLFIAAAGKDAARGVLCAVCTNRGRRGKCRRDESDTYRIKIVLHTVNNVGQWKDRHSRQSVPARVTCGRDARGHNERKEVALERTRKERRKEDRQHTQTTVVNTYHGNVGLGSVFEPGEELSRPVGHLLVRLSIVPERFIVSVVLVLNSVERDRGIPLLQLAHAPGSGGRAVRFRAISVSESGFESKQTTQPPRAPKAITLQRGYSHPRTGGHWGWLDEHHQPPCISCDACVLAQSRPLERPEDLKECEFACGEKSDESDLQVPTYGVVSTLRHGKKEQ